MMKKLKSFVAVVAFCGILMASPVAAQNTARSSVVPPSQSAQSYWKSLIPKLKLVEADRSKRLRQMIDDTTHRAGQLVSHAGLGAFTSEVLGLRSLVVNSWNSEESRRRLRDLYVEHVFDPSQLQKLVDVESRRAHESMVDITNRSLVNLNLDVAFDPNKIQMTGYKRLDVESELDRLVDKIVEESRVALKKKATSIGASVAGGAIFKKLAENSLASDGDLSLSDNILVGVYSLIGGAIGGKVADQFVDVEGTFKKRVRELTHGLIGKAISHGESQQALHRYAQGLMDSHTNAMVIAVAKGTGASDATWFCNQYFSR